MIRKQFESHAKMINTREILIYTLRAMVSNPELELSESTFEKKKKKKKEKRSPMKFYADVSCENFCT